LLAESISEEQKLKSKKKKEDKEKQEEKENKVLVQEIKGKNDDIETVLKNSENKNMPEVTTETYPEENEQNIVRSDKIENSKEKLGSNENIDSKNEEDAEGETEFDECD